MKIKSNSIDKNVFVIINVSTHKTDCLNNIKNS